jgi:hypothetical protein
VGSDAQYLRHHVLEVPIHQDISLEQLEHVARQVLRLGVGMERREAVSIPA